MDITFETDDGRHFEEEIWFFSPVHEIKEKLHKSHGFPISHLSLCFNGKVMEDERDFEHYSVIQGSRILLCLQPKSKPRADPPKPATGGGRRMKVTVLVPRVGKEMRKVEVEVNLADNVSELRKELLRMRELTHGFSLPQEGFFFIYKRSVMEEDKTFWWHDVRAEDVIEIFNGCVTNG